MKRLTILTVLIVFSCTSLFAQRTSKGQDLFSATVTTNLSAVGGDFTWGKYDKHFYWNTGLMFDNVVKRIDGLNETVAFTRFCPEASFMYRLFGTHNRAFSIYGGGGLFFGIEFLDMYCWLTKETYDEMTKKNGFTAGRFIYGGFVRVEFEFFPWRSWAFFVPVSLNLTGNSKCDLVTFNIGLGARFNY